MLLKLFFIFLKITIVDWLQKIFNILRQKLSFFENLINFDPSFC